MSGNKRNRVAFEFDATDLPMIVHAFAIARNTAMMCGHDGAKRRLEELRQAVDALVPEGARVFDGEVWCEIGMALRDAKAWTVGIALDSWSRSYERTGRIGVRLGNTTWMSKASEYGAASPELQAVRELVRDLAPMDCQEAQPDWKGDMNIRFAAIPKAKLLEALAETGHEPPQASSMTKEKLVAAAVAALDRGWADSLRKRLSELCAAKRTSSRHKTVA